MVNEAVVSKRRTIVLLHLVLAGMVIVASALEGWYGRPELFGDDISYLDVCNMIRSGDWKSAFNPLWSIGYPLLLSAIRPWFAADVTGEMRAVFWLNLSISLGSYLAFLWLLREIFHSEIPLSSPEPRTPGPDPSPLTLVAAAFAFLMAALGCARVSSVGPDLLVAGLFFVASALLLRFLRRPIPSRAIGLAVVLGVGYLVKAFFLPLDVIFLGMVFLTSLRERSYKPILAAAACVLVFVVPYATGLSWAMGRPTLGESGPLNYAFHVNKLPHWMGWQGDTAEHGTPVHPVRLVHTDPPVFAFGEPFHVTYPPQFNMPYWYEGYRKFTNIGNAIGAVFTNLRATAGALYQNAGFVIAVLLCAGMAFRVQRDRRSWLRRSLSTWPWVLPPIAGLLLYEQVHLEARYIAGFLAVGGLVPFVVIEFWSEGITPRLRIVMLTLLLVGGGLDLFKHLRQPLQWAIHRTPVETEGQWRVAHFLTSLGLRPGDRVASVSAGNDIRCTWAYASRLHVVAAIGNDAYDALDEHRIRDLHRFFEDEVVQRDTVQLFRQQGAVAVVAPDVPFPVHDPDWQQAPGTNAWVLMLH